MYHIPAECAILSSVMKFTQTRGLVKSMSEKVSAMLCSFSQSSQLNS